MGKFSHSTFFTCFRPVADVIVNQRFYRQLPLQLPVVNLQCGLVCRYYSCQQAAVGVRRVVVKKLAGAVLAFRVEVLAMFAIFVVLIVVLVWPAAVVEIVHNRTGHEVRRKVRRVYGGLRPNHIPAGTDTDTASTTTTITTITTITVTSFARASFRVRARQPATAHRVQNLPQPFGRPA